MSAFSILIASDLSDRSERALKRGFGLARAVGAEVTLVSIVDDSLPDRIATEMERKSREHLEAAARDLGEGVPCTILIEQGDPLSRLIELVNAPETDLTVVGRHRRRGFLDGFRKTTVESVVSQSRKPVLMAVEPVTGPYARVLAPTAFSNACLGAVRAAHTIAPGAEMRIIHAWCAPFEGITGGEKTAYAREIERESREAAKLWSAPLPEGLPEVELIHGALGATIYAELRRSSPDLLALGASTRALSFTGLGSFVADIVRDPPTDLLISRGAAG